MKRLLFSALLSLAFVPAWALTDKPNIVFILIDDMGWTDIATNGSRFYRTPNLDRLAKEGVRYTDAYAACAVCSPSRAALMTGRSPARLHITNWIPGEGTPKAARFDQPKWTLSLDPALPNLVKSLKANGYATASIGKWHLGGKGHLPADVGFDLNIAGGHTGHPASYFWPYGGKNDGHAVPGLAQTGGAEGEYLTDRLTDEALKFIDAHKTGPFYLYLAHYAVHEPLMAKKSDIREFEDTPARDGQKNKVYAAMIKNLDDNVGRVMDHIDKLGLKENTILVFTSDNGGLLLHGVTKNRPFRGGKGFPYEGGLRVPLIVRAPGVAKPGLVTDAPVIGTDFAPTFLALTHSAPLPSTDGVDITPTMRGETGARRELGWNYPHYWGSSGKTPPVNFIITPYAALRSGDLKIVRWYEFGTEELYDLKNDPSEKHDLAKEKPETLRDMSGKLDAWLKSNDAQAPVPRKNAVPVPASVVNPATLDKWR